MSDFKMFVGGLPQDCPKEQIEEYFGKFGTITDSVVMTDRATGRGRGFGFVTFDSQAAVDAVMAQHKDHQIGGKWIDCKPATKEGTKGAPQKGGSGGCSGGKGGYGCSPCGGYGGYDAYGAGGYGAPPAYGSYGGYGGCPAGGYGAYGVPPAYGAYGGAAAYGKGGKGYAPY
eukprot:TRINITY_DN7952_c0_g1_i1.p1 TRINITY_DN7952_c0_g1~~TRINITY_DN7952_c0_g1_i1.p1  ORF type:complete len:172 (+),score=26.34 TRINITY_DN7952_c0_g1_i1:57-572(+)